MFADFLNRLITPTPTPLPDSDARLALAALLIRLARADGHFDDTERGNILSILRARYDLDTPNAQALCRDAEQLETEAPDTVRFTRAIKDAVDYEHRLAVIEAMWQVALADGRRSDEEDALLRLVANLLGVSDRDSALARQKIAP